ncbi:MAG TPA: YggS family pyridoxal phosphate-dependent enzyme, partial [Parvularcula sp.]|nr:YggS family pyridoxal phosphate-dependent enzyme [Parvularcula sp.]
DVIETVDRPKIARAIADEMARQGKRPRLLVQVNTGAEPQKAGVGPHETDALIAACRGEFGLCVEGLMCIPPADDPPAPHFALLAKIAARNGLGVLSMGMSGDFDIAAQLGATHVRIGTALFGPRLTPA